MDRRADDDVPQVERTRDRRHDDAQPERRALIGAREEHLATRHHQRVGTGAGGDGGMPDQATRAARPLSGLWFAAAFHTVEDRHKPGGVVICTPPRYWSLSPRESDQTTG